MTTWRRRACGSIRTTAVSSGFCEVHRLSVSGDEFFASVQSNFRDPVMEERSMRLTLHTFLTLDGVMQAPGGPDEDRDGGFAHGGWSFPYGDDDFGAAMVGWFDHASAFLLGRKTYEIFASYWPHVTDAADPIASKLNALPKYVASTTLTSVEWQHSSLLGGDVVAEIVKLKEQPGDELQVHGSGNLAQTLITHDLIDEYRLLTFPVHLGSGKKLFSEGLSSAAMRLVGNATTGAGVVIATYEPDGPARYGSYALEDEPS
jgi:dihydrofolate reductase